jgi:hypothetical protein
MAPQTALFIYLHKKNSRGFKLEVPEAIKTAIFSHPSK